VLKCFFLFQFHTTCCFNNIMIYFMSLSGVYSSRILSTVAMLVTCDFNRGFFFLSYIVYFYLPNGFQLSMFVRCFNLFFSTYFFFSFNFCVLISSFLSLSFCFLFTFCLYINSFSISLIYWNNLKKWYILKKEDGIVWNVFNSCRSFAKGNKIWLPKRRNFTCAADRIGI